MSFSCDSNDVADYCTQITSNPDISGRGVRLAIYVQTLLSMLVASFLWDNEKAFRDTCRNLYVVSGSLIIATVLAWRTDQLSLFDALITSMLTTLMTSFVTVNGPYIRTLGLSINFSCLVFTSFWCYWGLQVWTSVSGFGLPLGSKGCTANEITRFVVLGHDIRPDSTGLRRFAIFIFALGILSSLQVLYITSKWILDYALMGPQKAKQKGADDLARQMKLRRERGRSGHHVTLFGGIVGLIYMIVTTEQIVARNPDVSQTLRDWTFGQTLALIMLAQQLLDCASHAKETHKMRREQKRIQPKHAQV